MCQVHECTSQLELGTAVSLRVLQGLVSAHTAMQLKGIFSYFAFNPVELLIKKEIKASVLALHPLAFEASLTDLNSRLLSSLAQ